MLPNHLSEGREELERRARGDCLAVGLGDGTVMCRVLGRYIVYADALDTGLTPHLCMDGYWESWVTVAIARALREGWHCVDVGANHGYFTLLMADAAGASGRTLAVEPNPLLARLAAKSIEVNGFLPRTEVLQKAAADADGRSVRLAVPRTRAANATFTRAPADEDDVIEVETVTLDSATAGWPRVDLVKIDAEGAEPLVWGGMRGLLARSPGVTVVMEFCPPRYEDPRGFLERIRSEGFLLRRVCYDGGLEDATAEQVLGGSENSDQMLFLRRD